MDTNPNLDLQRPPMRPHRFNVLRGTDRGPQVDRCLLTLYSLETWNSTCDSASRRRNDHQVLRIDQLGITSAVELSSTVSNTHHQVHDNRKRCEKRTKKIRLAPMGGKVEPQLERENYLNHARKASNWAALRTTLGQGVCTGE